MAPQMPCLRRRALDVLFLQILLLHASQPAQSEQQLKPADKGLDRSASETASSPRGGSKGYVITLKNDCTRDEFDSFVSELRACHNATLSSAGLEENGTFHYWNSLTKGATAELNATMLERVRRASSVAYVEEERVMRATTVTASRMTEAAGELTRQQRHLDLLDNVTDNRYAAVGDGRGVAVYVLDTGLQYDHPEFRGGRALFGGRDFATAGGDGSDPDGHGTYVASLVAGMTYGVAKAATLYSVRVLRGPYREAPVGRIIEAFNYVGEQIQAKPDTRAVVVAAFTGRTSRAVNEVVARLASLGAVVVTAAGNEGASACYYSPASEPTALTVGATDLNGVVWYHYFVFRGLINRWDSSGVGRCVDLFTYGSNLHGAVLGAQSGTSGSAGLAAGVVAVIIQLNSSLSPQRVKEVLVEASLKDRLDLRRIEKTYRLHTPNRFLVMPDISQIGPVIANLSMATESAEAPAEEMPLNATEEVDVEYSQAYAKWPVEFMRVDNQSASVYVDKVDPTEFALLFKSLRKKNYTLHYMSYSVEDGGETKFLTVFTKATKAEDLPEGYFNLTASNAEQLFQTEIPVSKVQFLVGYQEQGNAETRYVIIKSQFVRSFVSFIGQSLPDSDNFKRIMEKAHYFVAALATDSTTSRVHTYYFSATISRGRLYAFTNIQFSSLVFLYKYLRMPIGYLTSYQRTSGESRFMAVFDRSDISWHSYEILYNRRLSNKIDSHRKQGYYPVIITPWITPSHATKYVAILLKESEF